MVRSVTSDPAAPATVIVIDDDQALLSALTFDLELEGFRVIAHTRADQLRIGDIPARNGILVIDYRLPGLNGVELLERLRKRDVALPAILITSQPSKTLRSKTEGLGGSIVEKPLLGDVLLSGIRKALAAAPP